MKLTDLLAGEVPDEHVKPFSYEEACIDVAMTPLRREYLRHFDRYVRSGSLADRACMSGTLERMFDAAGMSDPRNHRDEADRAA